MTLDGEFRLNPFDFDIEIKRIDDDHRIQICKAGMRSELEIYCTCGRYCEGLARYNIDLFKTLAQPLSQKRTPK